MLPCKMQESIKTTNLCPSVTLPRRALFFSSTLWAQNL